MRRDTPCVKQKTPPKSGTIAARIWLAMKTRHATSVAELAAAIGVERQTVHRWLQESADNISPRLLFKVADVLEYSPRWLATGEGNPSPPIEVAKNALEAADVWRDLSTEGRDAWVRQGRDLVTLGARKAFTPAKPFRTR